MQTLAASGRLTEVAGPRALPLDREMLRLGLPRAAERKYAALDPASPTRQALDAFADGVNAWIDHLRPADVPVELRLLGVKPERWKPIDSIHLLNRMGWTLAWGNEELVALRARSRVGRAAADALFPIHSPIVEPIVPNGSHGVPRDDFRSLPPPGRPDSSILAALALVDSIAPSLAAGVRREAGDALGSNNWAVAPARTRDHAALLAGDPHLELTLPSIWYQAHLVVPGTLDVAGVTIPGAPFIVIGFNRDLAWTFTNVGADVLDWYAETVDDSLRPTRYRVDGQWRPIDTRIETYRDQHGRAIAVDTLRFTHRGPMRRVRGRWLSMRWTVLEPSDESAAFLGAEHARSAEEFLRATAGFDAPAQNMLVADRAGTIAIRSTGRYPIRPGDGRGDVIRDGSSSASDWRGYWPVEREPRSIRPAQGWLASNNQEPEDPRADARYLGSSWPSPWRAIRIDALLAADSAATPDDMRRFQVDPRSARAQRFVPALLAAAYARAFRGRRGFADTLALAAAWLAQWRRTYTPDDPHPVVFENAMDALARDLWDELEDPRDGARGPDPWPGESVTAELLADSASAWWDDRRTPARERRDDILARALVEGYEQTVREHGPQGNGRWRWGRVHTINIGHLAGLPGFGDTGLPPLGGPSTLSPSSGSGRYGPSWRMVVELGDSVRAWGTYPGGQSGNPASARYDDQLRTWLAGRLDTLRFPATPAALAPSLTTATVTLTPEGR